MAVIGILGLLVAGLIMWIGENNVGIDNNEDSDSKNFYFDITSSPNYVDYYYQDWGYGSQHYYPNDQYIIYTIDESLVSAIRNQVFKNLSAKYANQKINIDASFEIEDQEPLNELIFAKNNNATDEEYKKQKLYLDILKNNLSKRFDYYNGEKANGFMRAYVYKGIKRDIGKDSTFYIIDFSTSKEQNNSWSPYTANSKILMEYSPTLTSDISNAVVNYFSGFISGMLHGGSRIGEVVEVLSTDIAKIKLYKKGTVKKKMELSARRRYEWLDGGAELMIQDYEFIMDFFKEGSEENLRRTWIHYGKEGEFDLEEAKETFDGKALLNADYIKLEIEKINQNLESGFYDEGTASVRDDLSYFMEVIDVKDSLVTAKVIGSKAPMYYIRVGDYVEIK